MTVQGEIVVTYTKLDMERAVSGKIPFRGKVDGTYYTGDGD